MTTSGHASAIAAGVIVLAASAGEGDRRSHRPPQPRPGRRDALPRASPLDLLRDRVRRHPVGAARDPAGARHRRRHPGVRGRARPSCSASRRSGRSATSSPGILIAFTPAGPARRRGRARGRPRRRRGDRPHLHVGALPDGDRLVIPNEKLVSETLRNSTIRTREPAGRGDRARARWTADLRAARRGAEQRRRTRRTSRTSPATRRSCSAGGFDIGRSVEAPRANCV